MAFLDNESSARIRTSPLNNTASNRLVALHSVSFVPLLWHSMTVNESRARIKTFPLNNTASNRLVAPHTLSLVLLSRHSLTLSPGAGIRMQ